MPTILARDNRRVSYDPLALSESRRWSGDAGLISELTDALARESITLEEPGLHIEFDRSTPMHNVIAVAIALGFDLQSTEDDNKESWAPLNGGVKVEYADGAHLHNLVAAGLAMGSEPKSVYEDEASCVTDDAIPFDAFDREYPVEDRGGELGKEAHSADDGWPHFDTDESWIVH